MSARCPDRSGAASGTQAPSPAQYLQKLGLAAVRLLAQRDHVLREEILRKRENKHVTS